MKKITHKLHYVKVQENHIVIDFDIPDKEGIHLHYIYSGDASDELNNILKDHKKWLKEEAND